MHLIAISPCHQHSVSKPFDTVAINFLSVKSNRDSTGTFIYGSFINIQHGLLLFQLPIMTFLMPEATPHILRFLSGQNPTLGTNCSICQFLLLQQAHKCKSLITTNVNISLMLLKRYELDTLLLSSAELLGDLTSFECLLYLGPQMKDHLLSGVCFSLVKDRRSKGEERQTIQAHIKL